MKRLRERIAACLNWTFEDTQSFSFPTLREMVYVKDRSLADEINTVIQQGIHLIDRGDDYDLTRVPMPDMSWLGAPPRKS